MTATVRYPAGDVTPHGWWHITNGTRPMMRLRAYDGSIDFYLMGGLAPPFSDPTEPEAVALKSLKGLIPPWSHIDQKGATEDGVTNIDSLYEPIEVEAVVECIGRDPRSLRRVHRDLIASIDAKQESELSFLDLDMGYWWAPIRWFKGAPPDPLHKPQVCRQQLSLRLRADSGFWRSYDDTAMFGFIYDSMSDAFNFTDADDLGVNWPIHFYEQGVGAAGFPHANGSQVVWSESGTTERAAVIGPYKNFDTDTDDQVIEIELGSIPETFGIYAQGAFNDIWGRMSVDGSGNWNGDGIRARIGMQGFRGWVELTRFNNFVPTTLTSKAIGHRPRKGEKFSLVCGITGDHRMFRIMRNGVPVHSHKEVGTGSLLGSAYRGVGFGVKAGAASGVLSPTQRSPAWVNKISAGDNNLVTQSGFLARSNIGDQPMYDDYTFLGPGIVRIWDGPGAGPNEYVEFGPLLVNQAALLRTDPRDRNVYDLATAPAAPGQPANPALNGLLSFLNLFGGIFSVLQSIFGIFGAGSAPALPQGNMYGLLKGRFSDRSAIPAKSPGNPVQQYHTKVEIVGGTADSKIIASGVPLRRYPL